MKKLFALLLSVAAAFAAVFTVAGCSNEGTAVDPETYAFITVDINPSVEIVSLGNSVAEVKPSNYDACVLLDGEDLTSMTVEDATAKIVSLAEELGYLTDSNNQVKITVVSDDAKAVEILKAAAKTGAEKGSKKAVAVEEPRLQDELALKKLKEENPEKFASLTEEKLRLIESLMEHDSSVTYEAGAAMTVSELSAALKAAIGEDKDIFTSALRSEYNARYTAAKQEIGRRIAAVYGEEYLAAWEKYTAIENAYNAIADRLAKSGLSEEDVAAVKELLGISDVSLIEKGGVVRADYVLNYIDKHVGKKGSGASQTAVEAVIAILGAYDAESYVLAQEEIEGVREAIGEAVGFTTLAEMAADLSARKIVLDDMKRAAQPTEEQRAEIAELEEGFASVRESVLESMQESIAAARAEIAAAKRERGNAAE